MLAHQRDLFEIPEDIVYLNCAYMSPLLRSVREAGEIAIARKSRPWNIRPQDFFEESEVARHLFAELINADGEGIALVPSASYGINVAATNLSIEKDQCILLLYQLAVCGRILKRGNQDRKERAMARITRAAPHLSVEEVKERMNND